MLKGIVGVLMKINHLVFTLVLLTGSKLFAWGSVGHKTVGYIAEQYLDSSAKQKIQKILGNESLADVSNWADSLRDDSRYAHTKNYHFQNLSNKFINNEPEVNADIVNAIEENKSIHYQVGVVEAILASEQTLRKTQSGADHKAALRFLVHFVGDIHQPLHTGFKKDVGGNLVKIQWKGMEVNLHSLWDTILISENMPKTLYAGYSDKSKGYADYLVKKYNTKVGKQLPISDVGGWYNESYLLQTQIESDQYLENIESYEAKSVQVIEQRLFYAGVRLAAMLNSIYAQKESKQHKFLGGIISQFIGSLNKLISFEPKTY